MTKWGNFEFRRNNWRYWVSNIYSVNTEQDQLKTLQDLYILLEKLVKLYKKAWYMPVTLISFSEKAWM